MTNEEAIFQIGYLKDFKTSQQIEALDMAIKALEQQPCEDCISRAEALDAIEKEKQGWEGSERYAIDECHTRIAELPSVTPKARWIPVSEGLPEHTMPVLITVRRYDDVIVVRRGYYYSHGNDSIFHADNGICWEIDDDGLLAWQPLPQPYKEDKENEM